MSSKAETTSFDSVLTQCTVLLIELAMTKQTALESNLICGLLNQSCLHSAWLECTLLAHKSNNVLCSLPLLQRSTLFTLHYYVVSFIKSTVLTKVHRAFDSSNHKLDLTPALSALPLQGQTPTAVP